MIAGVQAKLDTSQGSAITKLLRHQLHNRIVGQRTAIDVLLDMVEYYEAGFSDPCMPVGTALFLGPTGTGKTHLVEMLAESLFGNKRACVRIDCAEFQHSHEIAKLIGSPPGYLGHRETHPALTQETLDKYHTEKFKLSIVLFDEIEKASDALWSLLLGILDNATLTLGDNRKVDFSKTLIIMTSNVGAREMSKKDIGFTEPSEEFDKAKLEQIAVSAAKSKFSPEFMNRIQNIVTFQSLTTEEIDQILDIELRSMDMRFVDQATMTQLYRICVSPKAKRRLLAEGFDKTYGARHLKRAITKLIQRPLARLINSGQAKKGDSIVVDDTGAETLDFFVHPALTQGE